MKFKNEILQEQISSLVVLMKTIITKIVWWNSRMKFYKNKSSSLVNSASIYLKTSDYYDKTMSNSSFCGMVNILLLYCS